MREDIFFPYTLKIEDHCLSTSLKLGFTNNNKTDNGRNYRLISVINHRGTDMAKGHYVCYVLDSQNEWIMYDDEKLKMVHEDRVFESQAYLLFYELI